MIRVSVKPLSAPCWAIRSWAHRCSTSRYSMSLVSLPSPPTIGRRRANPRAAMGRVLTAGRSPIRPLRCAPGRRSSCAPCGAELLGSRRRPPRRRAMGASPVDSRRPGMGPGTGPVDVSGAPVCSKALPRSRACPRRRCLTEVHRVGRPPCPAICTGSPRQEGIRRRSGRAAAPRHEYESIFFKGMAAVPSRLRGPSRPPGRVPPLTPGRHQEGT